MTLPEITLEGRLGADPELRFTPSGAAVATFRVACTERRMNQQTQQWEDGKTIWLGVECWKNLAENVAESLRRGDLAVITGSLYEDTWTDQATQQERTAVKIKARTVATSLSSATARAVRPDRTGAAAPQGQQPQGQDPWATGPAQGQQPPQQGGWQAGQGQPAGAPNYQQGQQQGGWGQPPQQQGGWQAPPSSDGQPPF